MKHNNSKKYNKFNEIFNHFLLKENDNTQLAVAQPSNTQLTVTQPSNTQLAVAQPLDTQSTAVQSDTTSNKTVDLTDEQLQQIAEKHYNELKEKYKDSENIKQTIDQICDACLSNKEVEGSKDLIDGVAASIQELLGNNNTEETSTEETSTE